MPAIISWLLGLLSAPAWLVEAAQIAWDIISSLPLFHKPLALFHLKQAVKEAKVAGNTKPLDAWHAIWGTV